MLEEISDLALKVELVWQSCLLIRFSCSKFHSAYRCWPWIEHQFAAFNPQKLETPKPEFMHRQNEAALGR
jgi:hypothetical protein